MIKKITLVLLIIILSSGLAGASEAETTLIPIPLVFSSPQTGFAIGGMGLYFNNDNTKSLQSRVGAFYTSKKQANLFVQAEQNVGEYKYEGQVSYQDWVNEFYGLNNQLIFSDGVKYDSQGFAVEGAISKKITTNSFLGLVSNYESYNLNLHQKLQQDIAGASGVDVWGWGANYTYDTRDRRMITRSGQYLNYEFLVQQTIAADYDFISHDLDYRAFKSLAPGHVLGWQTKIVINNGELPLQKMSSLGNMKILRGYKTDKFLAANKAAAQLEYRYPVYKKLSGTLFAGVAKVYQDFSTADLKESWGVGLRYNLNKKQGVNLRFDFAFNTNQSNFYFNIGEAF